MYQIFLTRLTKVSGEVTFGYVSVNVRAFVCVVYCIS